LVMVFMVIGVPPFSMVGRHETATLATQTLRVYRSK
jgi:Trk-type K+ transport system membrane component